MSQGTTDYFCPIKWSVRLYYANSDISVLVTLNITPVDPTLAVEFTLQFTAIGTFTDGTTENLTDQVTWISPNTAVASISNSPGSQGLATGLSPGCTSITALLDRVLGFTTLTVTPAFLESIAVTPVNPTLAAGFSLQFTAIGTFSDNTTEDLTNQVTWSSSNTTVAAISNASGSKGLATGLIEGSTTITATIKWDFRLHNPNGDTRGISLNRRHSYRPDPCFRTHHTVYSNRNI